jgi:soluble lytic murein transglycosylase
MMACGWSLSEVGLVSAEGLLSFDLESRNSLGLDAAEEAAALKLGRASEALDGARYEEARVLLEQIEVPKSLADHLELQRVRLLAGRGENERAAALAELVLVRFPESPVAAELASLRAQSLIAIGNEAEAQVAFALALRSTDDLEQREGLRRALSESRLRMAEGQGSPLQEDAGVEVELLPLERPANQRTAVEEIEAAREWAASGRNEEGALAYQRALEGELSSGDRDTAKLELGLLLFQRREYETALDLFRSLAPDPEATFWWARTLARLGQIDQSIEKFESLVASGPPEQADHAAYLAGTLYESQDDEMSAQRLYAKVAEVSISRERRQAALWRLGWLSFRQGDNREARARFKEMIDANSSVLDHLRPRYWAARAALRSGSAKIRRVGEAEMVTLATDWPLSYYGWRAQQRLGRTSPRASVKRRVEPPGGLDSRSLDRLQRVRLLQLGGFEDSARIELARMTGNLRTMQERIEVGRLAVSLGDFHTGQRLLAQSHSELLGQGFESSQSDLFWLSWPPAYRQTVLQSLPVDGTVEAELVWAIMREESGFRPEVMSSAGAVGLLQLMPETAQGTAERLGLQASTGRQALQTPDTNIHLGSAYLAYLVERFPGRVSAVIASYNAGPSAVAKWLEGTGGEHEDDEWVEEIPYAQTRSYAKRVLRSLYVYRSFY